MKEKFRITEFQEHITPDLKLIIAVTSGSVQEHEQKFFNWECETYGWPEEIQRFRGTHSILLAKRRFKKDETIQEYMDSENIEFAYLTGLFHCVGVFKASKDKVELAKIPQVFTETVKTNPKGNPIPETNNQPIKENKLSILNIVDW